MGKKIATCSYCGTRSVLVFDEVRHELACSACGAPLHDMKFMPQPAEAKSKESAKPKASKSKVAAGSVASGATASGFRDRKTKKKRKKKPMFRRVLEDIFDEIEDIFD